MASAPLGGSSAVARFAEVDHAAPTEQGALTLTEPQQATLLSRCLPLFKDTSSPSDMATQIAALCRPVSEPSAQAHVLRVQAFKTLMRLAAPANRALFALTIVKTMARVADGTLHERLGYRFSIDALPVVADKFSPGQEKPMLRFLREVDRAALPVWEEGRGHVAGHLAANHSLARQFVDAHLLNRLVDALPDDGRLRSARLDALALKIDQINTHAQSEHQQHVALGEKLVVLAEAFPEHQFAIKFATKFSFEGGHYAVVLQPAADTNVLPSPVPQDHILYEAAVSLWEQDQFAPMILAAVQRHVQNACVELQPLIDLATAPRSSTSDFQASPQASLQASLQATPHDKPVKPTNQIDINVILKNALSALREDYLSNLPGAMHPEALLALHRSVGEIAVGWTTLGALWELDKQVFDVDAERASLGLPSPRLTDPYRFA